MTEITSTPVPRAGGVPPISINIHGAGIGPKDRQRLYKILEKEMTMSVTPAVKAAPAKPGWQTTEWWATVLLAVGSVAASATDNLPPRYAEFATTISIVAYAISRGLAKR